MDVIDKICEKHKTLLSAHIVLCLNNAEIDLRNIIEGLDNKLFLNENSTFFNDLFVKVNLEELYEYFYPLKKVSQIALNNYQSHIFDDCEIFIAKKPEGLSNNHKLNMDLNELLYTILKYVIIYKSIEKIENDLTNEKKLEYPSLRNDISRQSVNLSILNNINVGDQSSEDISVSYDKRKTNYDEEIESLEIKNLWQCKFCTLRNNYSIVKCEICYNSGPHYRVWRCEKCTYFNDKNAVKCLICEEKNNNLVKCGGCNKKTKNQMYDSILCESCHGKYCKNCLKKLSSKKEISSLCIACMKSNWICLNDDCRFMNNIRYNDCQRCFANKESTFKNGISFKMNNEENRWQCQWKLCLRFNNITDPTCKRCFNRRYDFEKYKCDHCGWINDNQIQICNKCKK